MIVVCGEALFDVFRETEGPAGYALAARIGGSPFNLAIGLARLGAAPLFFGGLSNDMFGRKLAAALQSEGVDLAAAPRSEAPTALVCIDVGGGGVPAYTLYGSGTAERALAPADLARVPLEAGVIHVGSYCMAVEPVASVLFELVSRQRGRSLIAFDPNVRLTIQPDRAVWTAAIARMLPMTDFLKISDEDIGVLYPGMDPHVFIDLALEAGAALAVVTRGAQGVVAATAAIGPVELPAPTVEVIDTVGAGDTFQAALLSWFARRGLATRAALAALDLSAMEEALGFAAAAAAITCSRRGADLPRLEEVRPRG